MDMQKNAADILKYVGGEDNVSSLTHCATRLRFVLKDDSKADMDHLGSVEGVLTAQNKGGQIQVVIGAKVEEYYNAIIATGKVNAGGEVDDDGKAVASNGKRGNLFDTFVQTIASLFTPIMPALVGCGMIQAILKILPMVGVDAASPTMTVLSMMGQLVFYFLPFLLAVTCADRFKTNRFLALLLAGGYIYFSTQYAETPLSFLGVPFMTVTYTSTVIPIIISVFVMKYVYNAANKVVPEMLRVVLVPMIVLLIMIPLQLAVLGPIGAFCGTYIAQFINALFDMSGALAGALLGFFRPILVMFGMHYSIMPIQVQQVADSGQTAMIVSALCANIAQAGAALGVALKTKNVTMRTAGFSASVTALFGVTEPAIYGVTLHFKKPFFCACAAAAVTSGILGALGTYATAIALPGVLSIGTYECPAGFVFIPLMLVVAFVLAAVLTYVIGFDDEKAA